MNAVLMQSQVKRHHEGHNDSHATYTPLPQKNAARLNMQSPVFDKLMEADQKATTLRDWWKRTHGLETVRKWVKNYQEHPAGSGALLLIHGIPEVTGRLRSKVDNFAIYSALFLATAIAGLISPPGIITSCVGGLECEARKRIYMYSLIAGVVSQMLCIMLAMSFGNALNEAARDCDVFRMFSPAGSAFKATKKCEMAFQFGVGITFVATLAPIQAHLGLEAVIISLLCVAVAVKVYLDTATALFSSSSIVEYWRRGAPASDPYDLELLMQAFDEQADSSEMVGAAFADIEAPEREFTREGTAYSETASAMNRNMQGHSDSRSSDSRACSQTAWSRSCVG